jgi:hypothetical protein
MGIVILPLAVLVSLGSIICFIIVLVKLFQEEGAGKGILGLICGIYTLIWGWQNATRLNINTLMLVWTVLVVLGIILRVTMMTMSR